MAQFGRPSADTFIDGYTDQSGSVTNIYTAINEVNADDTNYIRSPYNPANSVYVTKLTSLTNPGVTTGHIIHYRYGKSSAGERLIDLTVELRQAYVSEASLGTLIRSDFYANIPSTPITQDVTLTGAQAGAITDYTNLYLRFIANAE